MDNIVLEKNWCLDIDFKTFSVLLCVSVPEGVSAEMWARLFLEGSGAAQKRK